MGKHSDRVYAELQRRERAFGWVILRLNEVLDERLYLNSGAGPIVQLQFEYRTYRTLLRAVSRTAV